MNATRSRSGDAADPSSSPPASEAERVLERLGALVAAVTEQTNRLALGALVAVVRSGRAAAPAADRAFETMASQVGRIARETAVAAGELHSRLDQLLGDSRPGARDRPGGEATTTAAALDVIQPLLRRTRSLPAVVVSLAGAPDGRGPLDDAAGSLVLALEDLDRYCADLRQGVALA